MAKRLRFEVKNQMVELASACFWYWTSFYGFLDAAEVPSTIYLRYPKETFHKPQVMRNVLGDLEEKGMDAVLDNLISGFYRLRGPADRDKVDANRARTLLDEFRTTVGEDPIDLAIQKRAQESARARYQTSVDGAISSKSKLEDLNRRFMVLASGDEHTPQQRGFALEVLFFDLLRFAEIEHARPFRTKAGEQIDGHFRLEKFDYLVEVKWLASVAKQEHISVFDGKIRGKAQSTRGLFLSANGFDKNAVSKFGGDSPRILLMTGEDLVLALQGTVLLHDMLRAKIDAMVRYGRIDFAAREMMITS